MEHGIHNLEGWLKPARSLAEFDLIDFTGKPSQNVNTA